MKLQAILFPTDFSANSEDAFRVAAMMARDAGARLVVLHVMPERSYYDELVSTLPPDFYKEKIPQYYKEKVWEYFHNLEALDPGVRSLRLETKLVEGEAIKEIVKAARESAVDMIVMGSHGRTGLNRLLMGSVAEHVLREAPCMVLTVKGPAKVPAPV